MFISTLKFDIVYINIFGTKIIAVVFMFVLHIQFEIFGFLGGGKKFNNIETTITKNISNEEGICITGTVINSTT